MSDGDAIGYYTNGETAVRHAARLRLERRKLVILNESGLELASWERRQIVDVTPPGLKDTLRLGVRRGLARLVITDPACISEIRRWSPRIRRGGSTLTRTLASIIVIGGASAVALGALFFFALPVISTTVAHSLPPELEKGLGENIAIAVLDTIDANAAGREEGAEITIASHPVVCTSDAGLAALAKLVDAVEAKANLHLPLTVSVVNHGMINALTLPGGQIMIFRGLIEAATSPEEVAGVLAHEVGHVMHRDPTSVMVESIAQSYLVGLVIGDVAGAGAIVLTAQALIASRNSREVEQRADAEALRILSEAEISVHPLAEFFDRLSKKYGNVEKTLWLFSSHPLSAERAARLRAIPAPASPNPILAPEEWQALRTICADKKKKDAVSSATEQPAQAAPH
jgi:hypothetical protein